MAEEGAFKSAESRKAQFVSMLIKQMMEGGGNPDSSRERGHALGKTHLYVSSDPAAPILVRKLGGGYADLYPASYTDPVGALAADALEKAQSGEYLI
jgi:hypothetical protein